MKIKQILLLQAVLEGLAGVILVFRPDLLLYNSGTVPDALALAKLYGIAAFIIGSLSFLMYKDFRYSEFYRKSTLLFVAFHFIVSLHMYSVYTSELTSHPGAFGLHLSMAVLFVLSYFKEKPQFENADEKDS
jgi:Kef-type K+ transport system membrane component KefB